MKRLLSLALSLLLVLATVTVCAVSASAEEADLAETGPVAGAVQNIGTDFYSHIGVIGEDKAFVGEGWDYEDGDSTYLCSKEGYASLLWRFQRQTDGTYIITNKKYNKSLGYYNLAEGNPVYPGDNFTNDKNRWYVYKTNDGGFHLCPKANTAYVVEIDLVGPPEDYYDPWGYLKLTKSTNNAATHLDIQNCATITSLGKPNFSLSNVAAGVYISWDVVDDAVVYLVYRYNNSTKKWEEWGSTVNDYYLDEDVQSNVAYKYAVKCIAPYASKWDAKTITYYAPPVLKTSIDENGYINVKWKKVAGVPRYRISMFNDDGDRIFSAYPTTNSLVIKDIKASYYADYNETVLNYFIGWSITSDAKKYLSGGSNASNYYLRPTPKISVKQNPDGYTLKWNNDNDMPANAVYRVYWSCKDTGNKWKRVADVGRNLSYTFKGLKNGQDYKFTVREVMYNEPITGFKTSATLRFYLAPKVTSFKKLSGGRYTIAWQKGYQAAKYRVFCWNGSKWVNLGDTTKTTATVKSFNTGKHPIYAVRTMNSSGKFLSYYWENILKPESNTIRYYYPGTYAK